MLRDIKKKMTDGVDFPEDFMPGNTIGEPIDTTDSKLTRLEKRGVIRVTDIPMAAFFITKGFKMTNTEFAKGAWVGFVFDATREIHEEMANWVNFSALVEPRRFLDTMKTLRQVTLMKNK